ncbi:hypothetical protein A0126_19040 (plasmid) [Exiguobacterium sp. N4-1P]|uniref:hypothetical protein n=1 Tax=Exiguobacterium sp. N4-1P TaxID=2051906 RepID=UPI000B58E877|nr:hypothetical protein [Exiguobacterium sp. N4-1P]ASI34043.1 hypothetical protein A0126_00030 [Exiguobacterium sp. N4-1P]ASI37685.1 hypothetical protein A0126_19040 [Exiguobacterium sp. N4-1P]
MELKWLHPLRTKNVIRISHLNSYKEDKFGTEIGDDDEGRIFSQISVGKYHSPADKNDDRLLRAGGIVAINTDITFENCIFSDEHVDKNYFVFCVCLEKNPEIQKSFGSGLQIIHNFKAYIRAITHELNKLGIVQHDAGPCEYLLDRKQHFTEEDFTSDEKEIILKKPYLVKDKKYEYQNEFRVVWRYKDNREIKKEEYIKISKEVIENYSYLIDLEEQERNKNKRKKKRKKK